MATTYGTQMTKIANSNPPEKCDPSFVGGKLHVFNEQVALASQASGDTIHVGQLPAGAVPLFFVINTDTSTGTATLELGDGTTADKFTAAEAFTTKDTPEIRGKQAAGAQLTAETDVILTVGTAALPAAGNLSVVCVYSHAAG